MVLSRIAFPYLTMIRKTDDAANPMNAADRKQFRYPKFVNQGVILCNVSRAAKCSFEDILPIADSKGHGVADQYHGYDCVTTDVVVAVDEVVHADCNTYARCEGEASHPKN